MNDPKENTVYKDRLFYTISYKCCFVFTNIYNASEILFQKIGKITD